MVVVAAGTGNRGVGDCFLLSVPVPHRLGAESGASTSEVVLFLGRVNALLPLILVVGGLVNGGSAMVHRVRCSVFLIVAGSRGADGYSVFVQLHIGLKHSLSRQMRLLSLIQMATMPRSIGV